MVVQLRELYAQVSPFLPNYPNFVAINAIKSEWKTQGKNIIRNQFSLILSWSYTIHKPQGKTLDMVVIYLSKGEKFSITTLVKLSCVHKLNIFFLNHHHLKVWTRSTSQKITQNLSSLGTPCDKVWNHQTPSIVLPTCGSNSIGNSNDNKRNTSSIRMCWLSITPVDYSLQLVTLILCMNSARSMK